MAHLANCPQCDHELLVPDGVAAGSWVRCPGCQAFFQLNEARARELPTVEVITSAPESNADVDSSRPTVADYSSAATLADDAQDDAETKDAGEERVTLDFNDPVEARPQSYDDLGFRELGALFDSNEIAASDEPHSQVAETIDVDFGEEPPVAHLHVAEVDDSDVIDVDSSADDSSADKPAGEDSATEESPEAAAERIDAWFRSAKTLTDVPPLENPDVDYRADRESLFGPTPSAANNATVEIRSGGIGEMSDDFELDAPAESPQDVAAWDDTHHMDQLLANFEHEQTDEFVPSATRITNEAKGNDGADAHAWAADAAVPLAPQKEAPRRKRSLARLLVTTVIGGLMAVPLAGYTLMWLKGPEGDFLGAAKYLPEAILPASFKTTPRQMATIPPVETKAPKVTAGTAEPSTPATEETAKAADATEAAPRVTEAPAEKLATFNEPVNDKKPGEPATFDAPPAMPVKEAAIGEPLQIKNSPSFTVAELSAALEAGKNAEASLVAGNLGDTPEGDRAKGFSYSTLADLAQKSTFVDGGSAGEAAKLQQEADDLFHKILSEPHARDEVGQIVLKWIASPNRKKGGVFFAGSVLSYEPRGPVTECSMALPGGQTLPVLIPAAVGEQVRASQSPVAVVGWIVDEPASHVTGYTGTTSQAVFASKLIPLE